MDSYCVFGDIHGRFDLLSKLLEKIEAGPYKLFRKVFLGDIVDRGPDSFKVVKKVKELTEMENAIALLGNHSDMMIKYVKGGYVNENDIWLYNGGGRTVRSYEKEMKMYGHRQFFHAMQKSGHWKWFNERPLYHETDTVWFSHAPVPKMQYRNAWVHQPEHKDFRLEKYMLVWAFHGETNASEGDFAHAHGKVAVCGHVHAVREGIFVPRVYDNIIYADTGCGCWSLAPLSAVVISDGKYLGFVQAAPGEVETIIETRNVPGEIKEEEKHGTKDHDAK